MADLIDSLIGYVQDIKPYHTKIYGVEVEYVTSDDVDVTITEDLFMEIDLGLPMLNNLESLAVAVGDDDGWDSTLYDELPYDIIVTEQDGFFKDKPLIVQPTDLDWNAPTTKIFDGKRYRTPTGFMDYAFVTMQESLQIEGQIVTRDVEDELTVVNRPWDSPIDGIDVVEYGSNYFKTDNNYVHIFTLVDQFDVRIIDSTDNDGIYRVLNATYDPDKNETTVSIDGTLIPGIPDGLIAIGFYDANEWDGDTITQVSQPAADLNAKSTICEGLTIQDGYGWDDPNVGWDATDDPDFNSPPGEKNNAVFFNNPVKWDDAYNIIDAKSTICDVNEDIGWDGSSWESVPWDADNFLPGLRWDEGEWEGSPWDSGVIFEKDALEPTGIVVFSPERMPIPNPRNIGQQFTQTVAVNTWTLDHNKGYYPIIRIFNDNGVELEPLSIVHTSQNQAIVSFTSPQTGQARVV